MDAAATSAWLNSGIMCVKMAFTGLILTAVQEKRMKPRVFSFSLLSVLVGAFLSVGLVSFPAAFAAPSGQINYFNVSGGACTSTAWTGPVGVDGNNPGFFPNNVGGPPLTAIVGTGSICVQVVLTGATPNTSYVITANKLTGTLTVTTDGSGNGSAEAVFTSSFSGACTTVPIDMSPESPFSLASGINHVFVGTGTTSTGVDCNLFPPPPVPEFPAGIAVMLALVLPALLLFRKKSLLQHQHP